MPSVGMPLHGIETGSRKKSPEPSKTFLKVRKQRMQVKDLRMDGRDTIRA
jgi:hypothetical protein